MLASRRTRTIMAGPVALRTGPHLARGAIGTLAASGPDHLALAAPGGGGDGGTAGPRPAGDAAGAEPVAGGLSYAAAVARQA